MCVDILGVCLCFLYGVMGYQQIVYLCVVGFVLLIGVQYIQHIVLAASLGGDIDCFH